MDDVRVDARGRIWTRNLREGLRVLEAGVGAEAPIDADAKWIALPMPPGFEARAFTVTDDDTIYICSIHTGGNRGTVFRRGVAEGSPWEELPVPGPYGMPMSVAADYEGRIWLGGERGEVFRLEGARWSKEVLPTPLHCETILAAPGGVLWARTQTRGEVRIVRRAGGLWRTVIATKEYGYSDLMYADDKVAVLRVGTALQRVSAAAPGEARPWIDLRTKQIAVESSRSAWAIRDGRLLHAVGDTVADCGEAPFLPRYVIWRAGQFWAVSQSGLWRMVDRPVPLPPCLPLGLLAQQTDALSTDGGPSYGLGVLSLQDRPHIYMTRHTTSDAVVPVGTAEAMQTWMAVSRALGLETQDESLRWGESYEMSVAIGDLNADRREDVLLSTMHDGSRMLRNMRDRRFVAWTTESGLLACQQDVAEDIDLLDADGDGDLDLYVSNLQGDDRLCLNDGAAHFVDVLPLAGLISPFGSTAALCRDLDGDGDTDIAVSTCGAGLFLHENLGPVDGRPRFATQVILAPIPHPEVATGLSTANFTGVEAQDFDNDGLFDLVVGGRSQPTLFLRNRGAMRFEPDQTVFVDGPPQPRVAGVVGMDPDADGDWDLALTGSGGARFLENVGGALRHPGGRTPQPYFTPSFYSTGGILVDIDQDLDLDFVEVFLEAAPVVYRNQNPRKPLLVTVRGPQENAGAVGARVEILGAGTDRRVVAPQEIPGGSGYASHNTKTLSFGGLSPDSLYDVSVRLPGGKQARVSGIAGRGAVLVDMEPGLRGRLAAAPVRLRAAWRDRWTRIFCLAAAASMLAVAAFGAIEQRRIGIAYPWLSVIAIPVIAFGVRQLFPLDPGGMPVVAATLAGLAAGFLAVGLARPQPYTPTTTLLADFARSLRVFEHNHTPRKIVDRIMLVRSNLPSRPEDWRRVAPLLREDVALFGAVVAPELAFVVEGARSVRLEHSVGARLLKQIRGQQRQLLVGDEATWPTPRALARLDTLLATTEAFRRWVAQLHGEVDRRLATPLSPFLERYAASRMNLHEARISVAVPDVVVRLPELEFARVMDILLENALRAAGGNPVAFAIAGQVQAGGRISLRVGDDGPGVPDELRRRLFEAGVTGFAGGTGYGLYAARRTVEHFGGRIALTESAGGACFEIELGIIRETEG